MCLQMECFEFSSDCEHFKDTVNRSLYDFEKKDKHFFLFQFQLFIGQSKTMLSEDLA